MMRGKEDESSEEDWQSHGSAVSGVDSWAGSAGSLSDKKSGNTGKKKNRWN